MEELPRVADLAGASTLGRALSLLEDSRSEWPRDPVFEACALIWERRRSSNPGSSEGSTIGVDGEELCIYCTLG